MKKNLLLAAFAFFGMATLANAQSEVKVTPSMADDGETPVFKFNAGNDYYVIYLGDETKATYASMVPESQYKYIGVDDGAGRHLYVWEDTFTFPATNPDLNSFGIPGEYMNPIVGSKGWSGLGYNIKKGKGFDMSGVTDQYTFHFAVKSKNTDPFTFTIIDKNGGHEAKIVLGKEANGDGVAPVADFPRDGEWYNVDVPLSYLADTFEFDFSGVTDYSDVNSLAILAGGNAGTSLCYDAVMYYGPHTATGINNVNNGVKVSKAGETYNLAGQKVSKSFKGLVIKDGKKYFNAK